MTSVTIDALIGTGALGRVMSLIQFGGRFTYAA